MKPDHQSEILKRLHCAAGHLDAVICMTETGQSCDQVLHQLNAVQAALRAAGVKMIECQAQSSQGVILNSPSVEQRIVELQNLKSLYTIYVKQYRSMDEVIYE